MAVDLGAGHDGDETKTAPHWGSASGVPRSAEEEPMNTLRMLLIIAAVIVLAVIALKVLAVVTAVALTIIVVVVFAAALYALVLAARSLMNGRTFL